MSHETTGDQPIEATGAVLHSYLEKNAESTDSVAHFTNTMAGLLANRLNNAPDGATPEGYVMATQFLMYDCKDTGKDGFTGEPMPHDVTGQPPMMYGIFQDRSVELASEAFGEPFGDAVKEVYARAAAHSAEAESSQPPALTPEQVDDAFAVIAKNNTQDLEPIATSQAYEVLKKVEGVEPIGAVLDGHPEDIPKEGWAITANMNLDSSAVIEVFRYGQGAEFKEHLDWKDSRAEYGKGAISMNLEGYGAYKILYEGPNYPDAQRNLEPYGRTDQASYLPLAFRMADTTELSNGGRIVDTKDPGFRAGGYHGQLGWTNINQAAEQQEKIGITISRVTDSQESMEKIVAQLGYAIGMDGPAITTIATAVNSKTRKLYE